MSIPPSADYPGGFDLNIGDGIRRARFRDSLRTEKLMEPGKSYPLSIQLYPTSNIFKSRHRIRLDISSSNFPRFDINPNTGEPLNNNRANQDRDQYDLSRREQALSHHPANRALRVTLNRTLGRHDV